MFMYISKFIKILKNKHCSNFFIRNSLNKDSLDCFLKKKWKSVYT